MREVPDCYYAYRLPGGKMKICSAEEGAGGEGFIIHPFGSDLPTIFLRAKETLDSLPDTSPDGAPAFFPTASTSKEEHSQAVRMTMERLAEIEKEKGIRGKTVISRVLVEEGDFSPAAIFAELERRFPDAFIFAFRTPATGLWIGASPEKLICRHGERAETMSLAGTRPAPCPESPTDWDAKNLEEQQIVTDFIVTAIAARGYEARRGELRVLNAGKISHLCTPIHIHRLPQDALLPLAKALSPTPALSGYPREEAMTTIEKVEAHRRGYYGGFCGVISAGGNADLYVNLRSGCYAGRKRALYAGGGITLRSDPEEEWTETERKLNSNQIKSNHIKTLN